MSTDGPIEPATGRPDTRRRPRPRRREVADLLRTAGRPLSVAEVAEELGVHLNTARLHLDALVAEGAAERTLHAGTGPGRPRAVYTRRPGLDRAGDADGYHLLARILVGQLAATGADAPDRAREAGRAWGGYLVRRPPAATPVDAGGAVGLVSDFLDALGFAPVVQSGEARPQQTAAAPTTIRLRQCPFLDLAEEHAAVVCPIHLGLVQGALAELEAPLAATSLHPFAEPDACLLRLEALAVS